MTNFSNSVKKLKVKACPSLGTGVQTKAMPGPRIKGAISDTSNRRGVQARVGWSFVTRDSQTTSDGRCNRENGRTRKTRDTQVSATSADHGLLSLSVSCSSSLPLLFTGDYLDNDRGLSCLSYSWCQRTGCQQEGPEKRASATTGGVGAAVSDMHVCNVRRLGDRFSRHTYIKVSATVFKMCLRHPPPPLPPSSLSPLRFVL